MLRGCEPSVKTAVDPTSYTINKFKEVWGDTYDYSKFSYTGARTKSTIICPQHGEFEQDANMHLSGRCGCAPCANKSTADRIRSCTEDFVGKAVLKYGDKFTYELADYKSATESITITCPKHGSFEQTPNRFLNGQTCPRCRYKESPQNFHLLKEKRNNSVLYVIECYNDDEKFIKIGVTTKNVKSRFSSPRDMPYNYNILREFRYSNIDAAFSLETEFLKFTKNAIYTPKLNFSGQTETRNANIKDPFLEYFDCCTSMLYLGAFTNFCEFHGGFFNVADLRSGKYTDLEIECILKGLELYNISEIERFSKLESC